MADSRVGMKRAAIRRRCRRSQVGVVSLPDAIVFLVDVDNTLLNNDHIQDDLRQHLERMFGAACRDRYWAILEDLMTELGYRDYLGALQRYRVEHPKIFICCRCHRAWWTIPSRTVSIPASLDVLERVPRVGKNRNSVRRRCGLPAAQGRTLRHCGSGEGTRSHLHPQGSSHWMMSNDVTRRSITSWWMTSFASLRRVKTDLGRSRDHGIPATGPLRPRPGGAGEVSGGRHERRAHWGLYLTMTSTP